MDKATVLKKLNAKLAEELAVLDKSARAAYEAATHEEAAPENQYDTRGLEASYLAGAQAKRTAELRQTIALFKALPIQSFGPDDEIRPTALVELEGENVHRFYFIGPKGGGLKIRHEGEDIWVITPQSPLTQQLLGKEEGDEVELIVSGSVREYTIVSVR